MKSIQNWRGEMDLCYQDKDLEAPEIKTVLAQARQMWASRCQQFVVKNGDCGSSVLGAGIGVYYVAPRARSMSHKMLISALSISEGWQGASVWEESVKDVLKFLAGFGIQAHYFAGCMD